MHLGIYVALSALAVTILVIAAMDAAVRQPVEEGTTSVIGHRSEPVPVECGWDADTAQSAPAPSGGEWEVPALSRFTIEYSGDPDGFPEEEIRACLGDLLEAHGRYIRTDYRVDHSGGGTYVVTIHGLWNDEVGTVSSMLSDMDGITDISHESEPHSDPWNLGYTLFVMEYDGELPTGEIIGALEGLLEADGRRMPLEYRTFHPEVLGWGYANWRDFPVRMDAHVMIVPGLWKDWPGEQVPFRIGEPDAAGGLTVWKDGPTEAMLKEMPGMEDINLIEPYFGEEHTEDQYWLYNYVLFVMEYNGEPDWFSSREIQGALIDISNRFSNVWIAHPDPDRGHHSSEGSKLTDDTHILVIDKMWKYQISEVHAMLKEIPGMTYVVPVAVQFNEVIPSELKLWALSHGVMSLYVRYDGDPADFPIREIMKNKDALLERRGQFVPFYYNLDYPPLEGNDTYYLRMNGPHITVEETDEMLDVPGITEWEWQREELPD